MHNHLPFECAYYLQHNATALAGHEMVRGQHALAHRLREIARLHRYPCWEHGLREIVIALLSLNALVIFDDDCNRIEWTSLEPLFDATLFRKGRGPRDYVYRYGAVPNTGRYARGHYYRAPRCHSLMVAEAIASAGLEDCEVLEARQARAITRNDKHVTAWDDVPRCRERNWKRQRATRWR